MVGDRVTKSPGPDNMVYARKAISPKDVAEADRWVLVQDSFAALNAGAEKYELVKSGIVKLGDLSLNPMTGEWNAPTPQALDRSGGDVTQFFAVAREVAPQPEVGSM